MSFPEHLSQGGISIIVVTTVFLALAILAVIGRFYSRYLINKRPSSDDYLIIAALIFTVGTVGTGYALVLDGGAGVHMAEATPEQIANALKLFVPAPLLWAISTSLVKLSILFFYINIFTMPRVRTAVWVVIFLTVAMLVAVILESFLLCRPFEYTWNKALVPAGTCGDTTKAYLSIAIVNLIIDLLVVALPMPVLWGLKMPYQKKLTISLILALGLVICGMTAARIKFVLTLDPLDFTYTMVNDVIFGGLEIELGIVNACLPLMAPLVRKLFGESSAFASVVRGATTKKSTSSRSRNITNKYGPGGNASGFIATDKMNGGGSSGSWGDDLDASPHYHASTTSHKDSSFSSHSFQRLPEDMLPLGHVRTGSANHLDAGPELESQTRGAYFAPTDRNERL